MKAGDMIVNPGVKCNHPYDPESLENWWRAIGNRHYMHVMRRERGTYRIYGRGHRNQVESYLVPIAFLPQLEKHIGILPQGS